MSDIIIVGPGGNSSVDLPPQPTAGQYYLMTKEAADSAAASAAQAANASAYELKTWAANQSFIAMTNIVRDANEVLLSANVKWPDGTPGVWTTDAVNANTPAVDAWHCTYLGTPTRTATQLAVTRDASGAVIGDVPEITIS